jgi:hypothetical protein
MLLVKELAAACPNADPLARHVVEVSVLRLRLIIDADLGNLYMRHIYMLSLELEPLVTRIMTKPPVTSLLLSTPARSHQN